jgi:hypothetical protein
MKHVAVTATILAALVQPLHGQPQERSFEVSPVFGYVLGGRLYDFETESSPAQSLRVRVDLADHTMYGLSVGYLVTRRWEPELRWCRSETVLRARDLPGAPDIPLTLDYFLAGVAYNLGSGRTRPYASVSAGVARLDPAVIDRESRFSGALALGVKTFVSSAVGLRFEARGHASRIADARLGLICATNSQPDPGGPIVPVSRPCPTKDWLVNWELLGGLVFGF